MRQYRRVAYEDRCHISALLQANFSVREVSTILGFHKSTIYRELSRNRSKGQYSAERASIKASERFKKCRRRKKVTSKVKAMILDYLDYGWSPEQISGRLKRELGTTISYQTIYRTFQEKSLGRHFINRRKRRRRGGRTAHQRAQQKNKVMISERPKIVDQRKRIGDWERDGMYGANRKQLLVFTDRKSKYTKLEKMGTGVSREVTRITEDVLKSLGRKVFTITNDNGTEFNDSASLPFKTYHCEPHKPQQRGTVENTIGLLRQYVSRKTDLDSLSEAQLRKIEDHINFRPRKGLDYQTPFEVFFGKKVALVK